MSIYLLKFTCISPKITESISVCEYYDVGTTQPVLVAHCMRLALFSRLLVDLKGKLMLIISLVVPRTVFSEINIFQIFEFKI